jgi:hypothetical protein
MAAVICSNERKVFGKFFIHSEELCIYRCCPPVQQQHGGPCGVWVLMMTYEEFTTPVNVDETTRQQGRNDLRGVVC